MPEIRRKPLLKAALSALLFLFCTLSVSGVEISDALYSFSPLARIYLKHLGLEDKNGNGVIDKGANEGYESFTAKYGKADTGFYLNGVLYGEANGKLEEPEIINHYYRVIRFNPAFEKETTAIENEVKIYIYTHNIPLVWLDDGRGTVMDEVNRILGAGWQERKVPESEALGMFRQVTSSLNIRGLLGDPSNTGYYTLSQLVSRRAGYCFEVAQFGFWFFSQFKIRSSVVITALTPSLVHGVIKLTDSDTIIDYFKTGNSYNVPVNQWAALSPLQSIGEYYQAQASSNNSLPAAEQALIYNKYSIPFMVQLLAAYADVPRPNHNEIIKIGEFILDNSDIPRIMTSRDQDINNIKSNLEMILGILIESYSAVKNRTGFNTIERLLNRYFSDDPKIKPFLDYYRF